MIMKVERKAVSVIFVRLVETLKRRALIYLEVMMGMDDQ